MRSSNLAPEALQQNGEVCEGRLLQSGKERFAFPGLSRESEGQRDTGVHSTVPQSRPAEGEGELEGVLQDRHAHSAQPQQGGDQRDRRGAIPPR